jgi:hypothetical protein
MTGSRSVTAMTFMRGLLVGVRDVGAHLGQEIQGIVEMVPDTI